jgi:altronate hydrolase
MVLPADCRPPTADCPRPAARAGQKAIQLDPRDDVATALVPLAAGSRVAVGAAEVTLSNEIPRGHKFALRAIAAGEPVLKYGHPIGRATAAIAPGQHVHVHNLASARAGGSAAGSPKSASSSPV